MIVSANPDEFSDLLSLMTFLLALQKNSSDSWQISLSLLRNGEEQLLVHKDTLREITDTASLQVSGADSLSPDSFCLMNSSTYHGFFDALQLSGSQAPDPETVFTKPEGHFMKTDIPVMKTDRHITRTDIRKEPATAEIPYQDITPLPDLSYTPHMPSSAADRNKPAVQSRKRSTGQIKPSEDAIRVSFGSAGLNPELFVIEDHREDCEYLQRPVAFAFKRIEENCFLLYYRKTVYDKGMDTNFRHYLSGQPGELVSYRYLHKVENLKKCLEAAGCRRGRGQAPALSLNQAEKILNEIVSLSYL